MEPEHKAGNSPVETPEHEAARGELEEVAECVRSLLGVSDEPANLGRLYRIHKEIQRQMQEIQDGNDTNDFCI